MNRAIEVKTESSLNDYTRGQERMLKLYELRNNCLLCAKYYGSRLDCLKGWNFTIDLTTALATSGTFTTAAFSKSFLGGKALIGLLFASTVLTVAKPILKLGNSIDHCSKLRYGYLELYQRVEALADDVRDTERFEDGHRTKYKLLRDSFNKLGLLRDPRENRRLLEQFQDEVERSLPPDKLWLPVDEKSESTEENSPTRKRTASKTVEKPSTTSTSEKES